MTADAWTEAERALADYDEGYSDPRFARNCVEALRALLAERPAPTPVDREALIDVIAENDWGGYGRMADALIAAGWHR